MKKRLVLIVTVIALFSCSFLYSCSEPQHPNETLEPQIELSEDGFAFELLENDTYSVREYRGQKSIVSIPDTFKEKKVTAISPSAFLNQNITEINIPEGIESIDHSAFGYCQSLKKIFLPSTVKQIGSSAFVSCTSLSEVHFGGTIEDWCNIEYRNSSVLYEGGNANPLMYGAQLFIGGERLEELIVPETCDRINPFAFCGYKYLRTVTFNGQLSIGKYAFFECSTLYDVKIPSDSTMKISEYAFSRCTNLTSIYIPKGISEIHETAFENCFKLIQVKNESPSVDNAFPDYEDAGWLPLSYNSEEFIDNVDGFLFVTDEEVNIFGEKEIYLLGYKGKEKNLELPKDYKGKDFIVYQNAFLNNPYIESVNISEGVKELHFNCFEGCINLKNVTFASNSRLWRIVSGAFKDCINLEEIVIPSSGVQVYYSAFEGCTSIKGNTYGNAVYVPAQDNPYFVLLRAADKNITYCEINDSCMVIHSYAFEDCTAMKTVSFGRSVEQIGADAFKNSGLEAVTVPESVTETCFCVFEDCKDLKEVLLPQSLKYIHQYLFQGCESLEKITILNPEMESIYNGAFDECSSLNAIYFNGTVSQWIALSYENPYSNTPIWGDNIGEYTVYCIDGTVNKKGELITP